MPADPRRIGDSSGIRNVRERPLCQIGHNAPSYETWRKEVDAVRRQGFSIDRGDYIAGVTVVAVPVLNAAGKIAQSIASVGISSQLDRATSVALAHDMQEAARAVAAQL
ncbi:MAG TPA: IclR family transcriptional regulator C-terminal domain-containing protein [Myxococcota bacterium]|nr:IclR family transcriptional regulator C-terminal domain-containing protein [Myxococcota bacterium]